ncbi:polyphosphate polymerase domain-containing protein [Georgenia faecalis]|uniref:polyphosphate polymerase domain-containing protein n=1 Tax=Georgenia faecalis TaxID=2483799 RepID=UPI000FDC1CB4|nr:polyphosphate polymerase domain-containing protein [Georgenia faecalis]
MTTPAPVPAALPLAHLAATDLAALNEQACLLTRVDRKYVLDHADAVDVLTALPIGTEVLEVDGRRTFGYRSVYFDTRELTSYAGAAHRRRRRFKVRTRTYLDSGECWLEVKTRGPRGATVKRRLPYDSPEALTEIGRGFVTDVLTEAEIPAWPVADLRPVLTTRYRRATLHVPASGARATVDTDLAWTTPDGRGRDAHGLVIVETKSGGLPCAIDRLLWEHGHRPTRVSKYATGLALLHDLPANRWRRALARLDAAPATPSA